MEKNVTGLFQKAMKKSVFCLLSAVMFILMAQTGVSQDRSLTLPLGPEPYRGKYVTVESGQVYSARSGRPIEFQKMIAEMKKARLIHLGETHDNLEMHDWQLRIIQALYRQSPELAIGLEQVTVDLQPVLDRWVSGELDEESFLREIKWYVTWNFNYNYYKKIFDFARENRIPIFALNAPRNLISKVRLQGYQALTEEERKIIPPLDLENQEHRLLIRTIFESEEIPPQMKGTNLQEMFEALYRAQVAWDETMGKNAVRAAETTGRRVVVLAGSGHMLYGLGLNYRAWKLSRLPQATVIGVQVAEGSRIKVSRGLADYVYGVIERDYPAFPAVNVPLKKVEGLQNLVVAATPQEALAKAAGFQKGDVILSAGGRPAFDLNEFRMIIAGSGWGEEVPLKVLRNGEVLNLTVKMDPELVKRDRKKQ
ncbi:MAG: ChaN family lipoprotein [Candidatus Saccharicenans sp.]|nr:ChaN family lipoprotein [Candidatus Saccharicenans sp.]